MRHRRWSLAVLALAILVTGTASAQAPKKKKPKKPKTEQKADPKPEDAADADPKKDAEPPLTTSDPPDKPPPALDTNLKEEGSTRPGGTTNPWVTSGIAKPKDGTPAPSFEGSDSSGDHKRKSPSNASRPFGVEALGGYASDNFRIGFGARVGYSILDQFYIGAAFTYHLGTTIGNTTLSVYYPALELGFDYRVEGVTIRPYSGVGGIWLRTSNPSVSTAASAGPYLTVYPGLQIDYQIPGSPAFVGVDGRAVFLISTDAIVKGFGTSIGVFGVGGVRL